MKRILTSLALAAAGLAAQAAGTTLSNGDFAFTGINVNTTQGGWSFVTFVDLAAGTTIYFTDTNVPATVAAAGVFTATTETIWSWTASADVTAGTSVALRGTGVNGQYTAKSGVAGGVDNGTVVKHTAPNADLSSSGDILYAYQAASYATNYQPAAITFLGAISNRATFTNSDNAVAVTGLSGIQVREFKIDAATATRYTQFTAQVTTNDTAFATMADLKAALAVSSNWTTVAASSTTPLVSDVLAVAAPVPEPESYALLLAGLGVVAGVARRRTQRR